MAFLLPRDIPSRSQLPARLRQVAAALRDFTPDEVTVWLRETENSAPYLVVLDPTAGIMVIDAPSLSAKGRSRRQRGRIFDSFDMVAIPAEVAQQASELRGRAHKARITELPVECVLAVPDFDEVPSKRLVAADRSIPILTRTDLTEGQLPGALRRILGGGQSRPLDESQHKRARAVVNPEIILPQSSAEHLPLFQDPEIPSGDVIKVMDRKQERVAEHLGPGYRVLRGVAGSGKTLVLAHRARHLHKHWPNWRILMLCYNRVLADALSKMVESDKRLEVINIDRLAYRLSVRRDQVADVGASGTDHPRRFGGSDFDRSVLRATEVARGLGDSERFDAVLVDEAQDFDHTRLDLAYSMLKSDRLRPDPARPDRDNFVMAYDVAQNVYRRGGARWNPVGVDAQGRSRTARGRSTVFQKNYRNTREILEFAMNFLAGSGSWRSATVDLDDPAALIPPEAAKRSGRQPQLTVCRDLREEAESIAGCVQALRKEGVDLHDIVLMYGTRELEDELSQAFSHRRIPYFHVQHKDSRGRQFNRDKAVEVRNMVRSSTLTGMKGLEFRRVLIGGVNHIHIRDTDDSEQFQAAKSQLYAAMTRAMDELEITMSGDGQIGAALWEAERPQRIG